jgi:gamma-glutamyltranspeptidase / glutathione hydrolase
MKPKHPNGIQAGKRPRVTLTHTLVLKDGKRVLAISAAGGDLQYQAATQHVLDYVEFECCRNELFRAAIRD